MHYLDKGINVYPTFIPTHNPHQRKTTRLFSGLLSLNGYKLWYCLAEWRYSTGILTENTLIVHINLFGSPPPTAAAFRQTKTAIADGFSSPPTHGR